ncbi:hypothetical protein [Leisingera sp. S232]|uniref:hypothetical protein n=1 Tax=Leisingera sp. S232 TaxID=3415132 RepID=UPI003C7D18DC
MSDPVTHAEIEDVLSSIRRLVSEDTRSQSATPDPAARLMLTPALRVQNPDVASCRPVAAATEAAVQPEKQAEADSQPDAPGAAKAEPTDAGTAAGDGAADFAEPAEMLAQEPPLAFRHHRERFAENSGQDDAEDLEVAPAGMELSGAEQLDIGETEDAVKDEEAAQAENQAPWGDPETTLFAAAAVADPGAAEMTEAQEAFSDTSLAEDAPAQAVPAETGPAEVSPAEAAPVRLKDESLGDSTARGRAASVVRKIAELEARSSAAADSVQQQWEPDSQTEAPFAGPDTIEWRDAPLRRRPEPRQDGHADDAVAAAEPELNAEPDFAAARDSKAADWDQAGEQGVDQAGDQNWDPERDLAGASVETVVEDAVTGGTLETLAEGSDGYIDEDSLRDLVASIVREELQGPLGERITRNVRKLVRREIQRALAANDLL